MCNQTCDNCKYYSGRRDNNCKRHAPIVYANHWNDRGVAKTYTRNAFPEVKHSDFCGDLEVKQ